jgi:hypothetical protein
VRATRGPSHLQQQSNGISTSQTFDTNTGMLSSTAATIGIIESFGYDSLNRLRVTRGVPAGGRRCRRRSRCLAGKLGRPRSTVAYECHQPAVAGSG